jgi:pimeloyl-ACP methyl ester carboxylesterase
MPTAHVNGIDLHYEEQGHGPPLVLVHGNWSDHNNWDGVVPSLAHSFRVVAYDRRGYGLSGRDPERASRQTQEDDLALLIEALDCAPAHVAGSSFGGSIALGLATRRPGIFASLTVHEPPLVSLVQGEQARVTDAVAAVRSVVDLVKRGDNEAAARLFVEQVALGPGGWELMPEPLRRTAVRSAPAFADEHRDSSSGHIDVAALEALDVPVLLTQGDQSPAWFAEIVARLGEAIPTAELKILAGAGHAPHLTHPGDYVAALTTKEVAA